MSSPAVLDSNHNGDVSREVYVATGSQITKPASWDRCAVVLKATILCVVVVLIWGLLLLPIVLYHIPVVSQYHDSDSSLSV